MLLILNIIEQVTYNYIYYYIMIYTAQVISRSETLNERACTARTVTIYILYDTCNARDQLAVGGATVRL